MTEPPCVSGHLLFFCFFSDLQSSSSNSTSWGSPIRSPLDTSLVISAGHGWSKLWQGEWMKVFFSLLFIQHLQKRLVSSHLVYVRTVVFWLICLKMPWVTCVKKSLRNVPNGTWRVSLNWKATTNQIFISKSGSFNCIFINYPQRKWKLIQWIKLKNMITTVMENAKLFYLLFIFLFF